MSKDLLLRYAQGADLEPKYYIVYEVVNGKVIIHSVQAVQWSDDVLLQMILTGKVEEALESEVMEAAKEYMKNNPVKTAVNIDFSGMSDITFDL